MISKINALISNWNKFWFAPQDAIQLALMRIFLYGTVFFLAFMRLWNTDLFNDSGLVPRSQAIKLMSESMRPAFELYFWPDSAAFGIQILHILILLLLTLGIGGRKLGWLAWLLSLGFIQRNYAAIYGADVISSVFLFYMIFVNSSQSLLIFNYKSKISLIPQLTTDQLGSVMFRMIQIHICIIYAYTGFEKLKGMSWWDGTALWTIFGNTQILMYDLTWLKHFPIFISVMTFTTVIFEIYFPVMMLIPRIRYYWLLLGAGFHVGIALLIGIWPFSLVMMSTYFLFIEPRILRKYIQKINLKT